MKPWRLALLLGLGAAAWLTLGRALLQPTRYRTIQLPAAVPLTGWQLAIAQRSSGGDPRQPNARLAQGDYLYRKEPGASTLNVRVHYLINTAGDVISLTRQYGLPATTGQPAVVVWRQTGEGEYGLFVHQDQAYLSTCINPRGGMTVTAEQFSRNRNTYDVTLDRLAPWILGQADLRDWRCLWLQLSIPVQNSPEAAYQELETVWKSLYPAWQAEFTRL